MNSSPVSVFVTEYSETEKPAANGVLAQRDVVVLRAGEVLQQVPVRLRRHDAQVEPEARRS